MAFNANVKRIHLTMDSHTIPFQSDIKLLGVILDEKLNFHKHLQYIINKATRIFNRLSFFCRKTWGAHPENIRTIYLQVIQPIITYAAGIWGHVATKKCVRRRLLSIQRAFALRAIRGFKTVSTSAALALALFTPIDLKVMEVHQLETTRITGTSLYLPTDITLEKHTPPHLLLHPAQRHIPDTHELWTQDDVQNFQINLNSHTIHTFTDGSKLEDGAVGAAFVSYSGERSPVSKKFKLHSSCSVFQAELLAILKACEWASINQHTHTVIYSDSRAAILATQNRSNTHPLVAQIHSIIQQMSGTVELAWVKSHAGIEERA